MAKKEEKGVACTTKKGIPTGGGIYCVGFLGVAIYFVQKAETF